MGYIKRNCNNCQKEYSADERNIKRGWGLCCSKSCAASMREKSKPNYDPVKVAENNRIRAAWNSPERLESMTDNQKIRRNFKLFGEDAPNVVGGSGIISGYTSEGYRIMDGIAYDEWDDPVYSVDEFEEDDYSWDSHK